jgi:hypothetical protein
MPIPTVPYNKKRQSLFSSEEDRQLRMLSMDVTMSDRLKESLAEEVGAGAINGPGNPDGTGPYSDTSECPVNPGDEETPAPRGGGMGRGRKVPGVPGTGPRGDTPSCPLTEDVEEDVVELIDDVEYLDEEAIDMAGEQELEKIIDLLTDFLGEEGIEGLEISVKEIPDKEVEEASDKIPGVPAQDGSGGGVGQNKEKGIPGVPSGEGPGKDSPECIINDEDEDEIVEEEIEKRSEEDTEEDTSGIPPWQYSVLKDYFENTDNPSYEDVANKMSEDLGDLTLENYMEAKNKFDAEDGEESVDLEEVELMDVDDGEEKEIAVASKKVTEIFPELNSYQKADMPK